ncbi:primosomal protein N' [Aliarcobacter butzleri]|uniref:Replication restart protein PriA n=1 Tax=Aliarcobacter butzleri TaxID=28197 RepID=A0AAP4PZJ2_9BACT|nr:primosomal protein N' [Aliarcobacter butzleri]KLE04191.1 primosomal protein DnaI [Aliarcobacter butzleri L353]MCG3682826.1 primosomal protein N' [Aliarcobacter butzleri]MCG3712935.1 primosomal protein N' [Aliarcobacter butzleri]MDN5051322.1 primosomal protein N' [Aliarcobacter butzleri]MDN5074247.1 primosomal protein N' [Aliarcobacter butzleri]
MYFYELALLKSPLENLTFQSEEEIKIGTKVLIKLKQRKALDEAVIVKIVEKPDFKCTDISEITNEFYDEKMLEIASFISTYYVCSLGEALSIYNPFDRNIEQVVDEEKFDSKIVLSSLQEKAKEFLKQKKQALLFANTGAGKTEIYIKIIEECLNSGKQAVLLMPEISLTPQMQKRLEKVFAKSVAIWHSKITKKKKAQILQGLQEGSIKLIAGARSALFLPYSDLGVIVVDEENDDSYKSDSKPRFHTKDLSIYIAKKYNLQLILGSATPSSSSFLKIPFFRLDETYHKTNKAYSFEDSDMNLSPKILNKIETTINSQNQVIVFLPTRANFKYQICTTCGKSVECPYCSVSMSLHKNDLALKCHYCGYTQQIPNSCPSCKTGIIHNLRVGTAQIEEELKAIFPQKNIKRFDRDEIKTENQLKTILNDFNSGKIDILVGTQMLSKGHDYHNVKLAVVLGIDSVLNMNSYKAREKALSLLIQISGRSGRSGFGEVIIQTKNQEFFDYYLNESNYEEFLQSELEFRKDLYPPYLKMAKVTFSHTNGLKVKDEMDFYVKLFKQNKNIEVVGFGQSPIFKIANKYRYEIILRSNNVKALLQTLHSINSVNASIDMDTIY